MAFQTHASQPSRSSLWRRASRVLAAAVLGIGLVASVPTAPAIADAPKPAAAQQTPAKQGTTFTLDTSAWNDQPNNVYVAGSFNGWNPQAQQLAKKGTTWSATLDLPEGVHFYKFVVDVGWPNQRWINDPNSDKSLEESDGHGGMNSAILVGPDARKLPAPQPNTINAEGVAFDAAKVEDVNVVDARTIRFRLRTQANDVEKVVVHVAAADGVKAYELARTGSAMGYDVWGGVAAYSGASITYWFTLTDGGASAVVEDKGVRTLKSGDDANAKPAGFSLKPTVSFNTPAWARDAVWYQIFPERFRNGDARNDPGDLWYENLVPWNGDWWADLPGEVPASGPSLDQDNFYRGTGDVWRRRYGGDLQGVKEKLPYLRSVGINAIYLNPIFEAESMHKYDTADFRHVDDNFGERDEPKEQQVGSGSQKPQTPWQPIGNRKVYNLDGTPVPAGHVETDDPATWRWTKSDLVLLDLIKEAHKQGFTIVLDGVFNHVGRAHPFFQDVVRNGKNSPYASWFEIESFPETLPAREEDFGKPGGLNFKAWDQASGHLPAFKKDPTTGLAKGPYEHIMAITRRWLDPDGNPATRDGIDGWRLDVANDIPHPFWREWRKTVKAANPEAIIVGEIWSPAQPWINDGQQFDAVMNYQFAMPSQAFFANRNNATKPAQFSDALARLQFMYPYQAALVMQNLFDSHDTDRAASWFVNPDRNYDSSNRPQDNAADNPYSPRQPSAEEWTRFKQMTAFQMTFVGAPMVYYGDEVGMWSPDDPSNRQPFPWEDKGPYAGGVGVNKDILDHYRRFIAIRHQVAVLRDGFYAPVKVDDEAGLLVFSRTSGEKKAFVAVNRSGSPRTVKVNLGAGTYVNWADASQATLADPKAGDPAARSTLTVLPDAKKLTGEVEISLPAWGIAILATP